MFLEPQPTPFDLRWRMLGTDIRVHPLFWVFSAILGWSWYNVGGFNYLLLWVLCVFGSVLLHEFGHVLMGRLFGSEGRIILWSFGGLAVGVDAGKRWQRILISFAGPAIQLILLGILIAVRPDLLDLDRWVLLVMTPGGAALVMLFEINLFWPILNLLPIWPLDGGQITREIFDGVWKGRGMAYSLLLSGIVSAVLAVHCLLALNHRGFIPFLPGGYWGLILFGMLAAQSFQLWAAENQRVGRSSRYDDDRLPWE